MRRDSEHFCIEIQNRTPIGPCAELLLLLLLLLLCCYCCCCWWWCQLRWWWWRWWDCLYSLMDGFSMCLDLFKLPLHSFLQIVFWTLFHAKTKGKRSLPKGFSTESGPRFCRVWKHFLSNLQFFSWFYNGVVLQIGKKIKTWRTSIFLRPLQRKTMKNITND